ncbi:MAG: carboxypeptidase regulatory-like domain-containing protein [Deltaproteobacteria bacterium]|nr:carboxypeptidase regulatory-like domain-containing protein [Deltaproteobacteria bacterium]
MFFERCSCDERAGLTRQTCATERTLCPVETPPDTVPQEEPPPIVEPPPTPPPAPPPATCAYGRITGRVCATDNRTWVNGAAVTIASTDCDGADMPLQTTTDTSGAFTLTDVPIGRWTVHAELGSFTQDVTVDVEDGETTAIPDNDLCVAQKDVKIAVITGMGDKIEDLLDSLSLTYTLYSGKDQWSAEGEPFLRNLTEMKKYDIIFVDCGAAHSGAGGSKIDLGGKSAMIAQNLAAYVAGGGSVYASDWSLLFAHLVDPAKIDFVLRTATSVANPLATNQLMGYAPQNVTTTITEPALAAFLGKSTVAINFPAGSSKHWGLIEDIAADVGTLVSAPTVTLCNTTNSQCDAAGATATNIPFAVRYKLTPAGEAGGWVVYTSFHNQAQTGDDVANILKFLVLHL